MSPLLILAAGMATVLGLIVALRVHAFLALLAAALVVSLLAVGPTGEAVAAVAQAFGATAASIGIVIAFAAVIGKALTDSGAAERIVRSFTNADAEGGASDGRVAPALVGSGAVLSVPVFFDTVFYLLVPLARSAGRVAGRHYLKFLLATAGGAIITHALVPPTPGPLVTAAELGVDLGTMMLVGLAVGAPCVAVVLAFARWADARFDVALPDALRADGIPETDPPAALPGLGAALAPIVLPVVLITAATVSRALGASVPALDALGDPNLALGLATVAALAVYARQRRPTRAEMAASVEEALMSGGVIILITAAGGAFGAMLRASGVGDVLAALAEGGGGGVALLFLAFGTASLLKIAQGSSTVAMITTVGLISGAAAGVALPFHPVYLATAIASGSLVGSWMNDSGFWIFAKMGGLSEVETLKTWTPLLAVVGVAAFGMTLLLALVLPMVG